MIIEVVVVLVVLVVVVAATVVGVADGDAGDVAIAASLGSFDFVIIELTSDPGGLDFTFFFFVKKNRKKSYTVYHN